MGVPDNETDPISMVRKQINNYFAHMEPSEIITMTAVTIFIMFFIKRFIDDIREDGLAPFFYFFRNLPFIRQQVEKRMNKIASDINKELQKGMQDKTFIKTLPKKGWDPKNILNEIQNYCSLGNYEWSKGFVSGAVYLGNDNKLMSLVKDAYGLTSYSNPLHPDIFPGIRAMEAEIIQMVASLFHAPRPVGTVTSGGTESIFLVCKAFRDYAKNERGIKDPNMVIPVTAHAAFDKAAQLLKIKVKHIKFDPKTTKVDIKAMEKAIDKNTCMLVGSAPAFPHGSIDPIEEISKLGCKNEVPVHVDACLGGFLIAFMDKAGYSLPLFDFHLPGVTSISVDTHKYAYAPKGSSVILYRAEKYRRYQFSVQPDWPGGIYGTPNLSGTRSGGIIATCWASLLYHGIDTYVECTEKIISVTKKLEDHLRKIKEIYIIGKPEVSIIAVGSKVFDIYRLSSGLNEKGWNLNVLQFPSGFHICVTMQHTYDGVAEKFISDLKDCVAEIMKNPNLSTSGTAAIYGMAQQIPDRSLVSEIVWAYLDACYSLDSCTENGSVN